MANNRQVKDIRSFFTPFSKPAKRPPEKEELDRELPKSPKIDGGHGRAQERVASSSPRSVIVLIESEQSSSESEDSRTQSQLGQQETTKPLSNPSFTGTLPSSSFASASQRVVKRGEVVVTNSDDDSDVSSDIVDIDALLAPKLQSQKAASSNQVTNLANQQKGRLKSPDAGFQTTGGLKSYFKIDSNIKSKRLLEELTSKTKKDQMVAAEIQKARSAIDDSNTRAKELESNAINSQNQAQLDSTVIAAIVGETEDVDGLDRLMRAMKRTEAFQSKPEWSFFSSDTPDLSVPMRPPDALRRFFGSRQNIEMALLNGFLNELIEHGEIQADEDVLEWTLSIAITSPREDLCTSYCNLVRHADAEIGLSSDWVWRMFSLMGGSGDALDQDGPVQPVARFGGKEEGTRNWSRVLRILEIVSKCAGCLPTLARREALILLCKLALDYEVSLHHRATSALRGTIDMLLLSIPEDGVNDEFLVLITNTLKIVSNTTFRLRLVRILAGVSVRGSRFRHLLALAIFLDARGDAVTGATENLLKNLTSHVLQHPSFDLSLDVDFAWLAATVEILDTAIDNGGLGAAVLQEKHARREFDRGVDKLAESVRDMATNIKDSGANHLSRTEAKESLDALHARLLYAVRSESRQKKSIFGGSVHESGVGNEKIMKSFLQRGKVAAPTLDNT